MACDHIKRLTIDFDGDLSAEEMADILSSVGEKFGQCWADTTSGPIHDADGKHVANAMVQVLPLHRQLAVIGPLANA